MLDEEDAAGRLDRDVPLAAIGRGPAACAPGRG
jgi:hypothetical protein